MNDCSAGATLIEMGVGDACDHGPECVTCAHTRGHGILGERQRSESTCDPMGSIARATRTRGELERARNVRRAAFRERDEGSMAPDRSRR